MLKSFSLAAALCAALPALASPYVPLTSEHLDPEPVVIEVASEDLARCIATVAQVLSPPINIPQGQSDVVTPAAFEGPSVTCVAKAGS